jgi:hypothetical protein
MHQRPGNEHIRISWKPLTVGSLPCYLGNSSQFAGHAHLGGEGPTTHRIAVRGSVIFVGRLRAHPHALGAAQDRVREICASYSVLRSPMSASGLGCAKTHGAPVSEEAKDGGG